MIKVGLVLLLAGGLITACGSATETVRDPTPHPCASPPAAAQTLSAKQATNEADCFLAGIVVPAGAHRVSAKTLPGLTTAPVEPACTPLIDQSRIWTLTGTAPDVQGFLRAHPAAGMTVSGYTLPGSSLPVPPDAAAWVSEVPTGAVHDDNQLVVSVLDIGKGMVGIRADAQIIPAGAACSSAGGGAAAS